MRLADEFLFLALDDHTGRFYLPPRVFGLGLAGALLAELILEQKLGAAVCEVAVILGFSLSNPTNPAGGTVSLTTLDSGNLFGSGSGALLALGVLGFVGFEAATSS